MAKQKKVTESGQSIPDWTIIEPDMKPINKDGIKRDYNRLLWEALSYVHYDIADKKLAAEFVKYCAKHFDKKQTNTLKKLPDRDFAVIGKYTYALSQGARLDQSIYDIIEQHFHRLVEKATTIQEEKKEKINTATNVISIQDRMREQVEPICGEWNHCVDEIVQGIRKVKDFNPYKDLQVNNFVKPAHAKLMRGFYERELEEAQLVAEWKDEEIKEAYDHFKASDRKNYLAAIEKIVTACDTVINTGKATRKPRKRKSPDKQKLVAKLKFKESEPNLGLASVNAVSIIEANSLWVYNTKNRKLGIYVADEFEGPLSVKGTTIQGFDPVKSTQKTVRKPEELKGSDRLSRTKFDKFFKALTTTETALNGRLNEHTLLIKVF